MHPDHAADLVASQVDALTDALADLDLPVSAVELRDRTELLITYTSRTTRSIAGIGGVAGSLEVPLLGTMQEEVAILRLDCEDFDAQPPTAVILDAQENPLPPGSWPHEPKNRGIVQGHPIYGDRKFFCRPGTREFHTHPQHEDDPWDRHREGMTIDAIALGILRDLTVRWTIR